MKKYYEIVTEEQIKKVWGNANFGADTPRQVIATTLLQYALRYSTGHTSTTICQELGLLGRYNHRTGLCTLTDKGREYLYSYHNAQKEPDYYYNPDDWEFTAFALHEVNGVDYLDPGEIMKVNTLIETAPIYISKEVLDVEGGDVLDDTVITFTTEAAATAHANEQRKKIEKSLLKSAS